MKKIIGSICALATPFRAEALDLEAFGALIDYQLNAGTQGLVVAGSTGEAHALDQTEYDRLLAFAVERVGKKIPVLAGTGTANTQKTIHATRRAHSLGADGALVVTPYYVRPTQDGLLRHFSEVADHGGLPVVLYNVPSRTGCDLLPETTAKLARHTGIVGIKEARADAARIDALIGLKSAEFSVLSGDDPTCARAILAGAEGVISVAANLVPAQMRAVCDAALAGNVDQARKLDANLVGLYEILGVEPNPIPLKWCLQQLGIGTSDLRLPLLTLGHAYHERARQVLNGLNLPATVQPRHSSAA